ncbi:golgin subfamily A member 6-like protein 7 [Macrobrachium nipponense]|uniref:golgin subfamily A member 6-like protein 7 n=1 Tax=Macrobrachium nipponense TaxID=159736 RepID=UPI0030C7A381
MEGLKEIERLKEELRLVREAKGRLEEENERLRADCEELKSDLEEMRVMLRSVKVEMKGGEERMVEKMDEKFGIMMNAVQEMMQEMMKEFMGEGAVGGRPTGSCDRPGVVKEVKERVDESMSNEGDLVVIGKGKKGKTLDKDKPAHKDKKGAEEKKKPKGKKVGKGDGQDETRTEYIGERAESDSDSGEWKRVDRKKKGKRGIIRSMDASVEVDSLYSEEGKRGQNGSSESESERYVPHESVKARIVEQAKRIKSSIRYRKKQDYEEARMNVGESLSMYVYRLEKLARKKFGDEGINESYYCNLENLLNVQR